MIKQQLESRLSEITENADEDLAELGNLRTVHLIVSGSTGMAFIGKTRRNSKFEKCLTNLVQRCLSENKERLIDALAEDEQKAEASLSAVLERLFDLLSAKAEEIKMETDKAEKTKDAETTTH